LRDGEAQAKQQAGSKGGKDGSHEVRAR
jgi:hypothetical protein